ncbi:conserved hypothetical protein, partial [Ricinus communis]
MRRRSARRSANCWAGCRPRAEGSAQVALHPLLVVGQLLAHHREEVARGRRQHLAGGQREDAGEGDVDRQLARHQAALGIVERGDRIDQAHAEPAQRHLADAGGVGRLHHHAQRQALLRQRGLEPAVRGVLGVEREEGRLHQLLGLDAPEARERMALRHHDHAREMREGRMLEALERELVGHQAEVGDAHRDPVAHVLGTEHLQRHLRPGARAAVRLEALERARHEAQPEGRIAAELELVGAEVAQAAHPVLDRVHADEHALDLHPQRARLGRGHQPPAGALEQLHARL